MNTWDLIIDREPGDGAWNMAVDEHLFESLDAETPHTILRFYAWKRPTVSIGYSQKAESIIDVDFCRTNGVDIVRRITGGKLVLHHKEVTYSLMSTDNDTFPPTVAGSYQAVSEALMVGLREMGLNPRLAEVSPEAYARDHRLCFSYPARNEVEVAGKKIIGSAQKRIGPRFIQHGLIPLEDNEKLLALVALSRKSEEKIRMMTLSEALGKDVDFEWAVPFLCKGIADYFGVDLKSRTLKEKEIQAIQRIKNGRYANRSWTFGERD